MRRVKRRLLAGLICLVLTFTDIIPVGFQVLASEVAQSNMDVNDDIEEFLDVVEDDLIEGDEEGNSSKSGEGDIDSEENSEKEESDTDDVEDELLDGENMLEECEKDDDGEQAEEIKDIDGVEEVVEIEDVSTDEEEDNGNDKVSVHEEKAVTASGKCGDNLTWTLEDGTLTISGTGKMYDYGWQGTYKEHVDTPWAEYCDTMRKLVIEDGVTSIGISAFEHCSGFTGDLIIPDSVTEIRDDAFFWCSGFTGSLIIPGNVTEIGRGAFSWCSGFTGNLIISDSVTEIGSSAFEECSGFTGSLVIPDSVTKIGGSAFSGCSGFTDNLTIGNSVTEIGSSAFEECSGFTGSLVIPDRVTKIGKAAFSGCSGFTGNLTIGNSVTVIGWYAFEDCNGFTGDLIIPDGVTEIGDRAFENCSGFTGNLIIGNNVKKIGDGAFDECDGFTGNLTIGNSVTVIDQYAFFDCNNFTGDLIIPTSVEKIQQWAFGYCSGFSGSLTIPDSVVQLGNNAFFECTGFNGTLTISNSLTELKTGTFSSCSGFIGDLIIPDSILNIETEKYPAKPLISKGAFEGCSGFNGNLIIGNNVKEIGRDAFKDCNGFTGKLAIGHNVIEVGNRAFENCSRLTGDLIIGEKVTTIGACAFANCSSFTGNLVIPDSVTEIGYSAFENCSGFTGNLTIGNSVTEIGYFAFKNCSGFIGNLIIPDSVIEIEYSAFENCSGFNGNLVISNNITEIRMGTFYGCSGFTGNLVIPNGITNISDGAFGNCNSFTGTLTIPYSVTNIGSVWSSFGGAFSGCSGFTGNLILPNSITNIGYNSFSGCSGFTGNLILPNSITNIGYNSFSGCSGFTGNLLIPDSITQIEDGVFAGCSGFNGSLSIPDSVTSIGKNAFKNCTGFNGTLVIPDSVASIGQNAFGPFDSSQKVYWHCTLNSHGSNCVDGGMVIYDDDVPEPTYLSNSILIKLSDYEATEGDFPSEIQIPSDKAAVCAVDSTTGRIIRSAYVILDGQTYRTDAEGIYYFSLSSSGAVKRFVGATADGYLQVNAKSMSVQLGKLTTVTMTKIISSPAIAGDDIQTQVGKFVLCATDENGNVIKDAVIEIDGDRVEASEGVFYAVADSSTHYVTASAKGYLPYLSSSVVFSSGGKFCIYLRWSENSNVTYKLGKVKSGDVFSKKIWLESGEYSSSDSFDFTKLSSLTGSNVILKLRDGIAVDVYTIEECTSVSVSLSPDTSSFIYQNGHFSSDTARVYVRILYDYKSEFPKNLFVGIEQPKFQIKNMKLSIEDGMKVLMGNQSGNYIELNSSQVIPIGDAYSFETSAKLMSTIKPTSPSASYKMAVQITGSSKSYAGFQIFRVADADYKKVQTNKRPTTQGSDVSKESVTELLEGNILFNLEGTVLEQQYFSKEQLKAIEKMLTLWVVNIDAATDTAREISYEEKFVMDVLKKLKVNIKPYLGVSETTAQMRIKAETKSYGERTIIFTLNLTNFSWDSKAPFGKTGNINWYVENTSGIPKDYQEDVCAMIAIANTDQFLMQLKELAFSSIKDVYNKTWGNQANKVAEMIIDKRILEIVNQEFGSVSDMCFKLMIKPTEDSISKGGRKKSITRCPVDLYVYDSQGNIAGAIIDNIAYPMDDGVLVYMEDGAKVVDYFADEYTVKFVGSDSGTMSHEVYEYYSTGEVIRQIEFKDVPLEDGKIYQETIPDFFFADPAVYALKEEGMEAIHPDTDSYEEEREELVLVEGISVTPDAVTLKIGEEKALDATIMPETASLKLVEWISDNENIVTVSDSGILRAVGAGNANVNVISLDGRFTAECIVTVEVSGSEQLEEPEKPGQGDVLDEDMPQGGLDNIPKGLWMSEVAPQIYTGKQIKPVVRVYDGKTLLTEKRDYTIAYKNNTKANDAKIVKTAPTITVTGKGNYTGKETQTFQILPKDITDADVVADDIVSKANSKIQKPTPTVIWNEKKLTNKRDFSISYTDTSVGAYKECGTYEIMLTGMGNYTGNRQIKFTITGDKLVSKLSVTKIASQTYTGNEVKPAFVVKDSKLSLTENEHYTVAYENNINVGTATVIITGMGEYVGTKRINFKIMAVASLGKAKVSMTAGDGLKYNGGIYTGKEVKPNNYTLTVTVKGADKKNAILTLKEGIDYTVSYKNNIKAGIATIIFTGINGYTGSLKKTYKITPYDIKNNEAQLSQQNRKIKITLDESYSYVKGGSKPKPVITFEGKELKEKVDYTLSYKNNTSLNSGENVSKLPAIIIKGKGNFKGQVIETYLITQADISRLSLIAVDKVWQNKVNIYKTKVTVKDVDGKALSVGKDYDRNISYAYEENTELADGTVKTAGTVVSVKDVIPAGTAIRVTVNAKNINYYGAIYGVYRIAKADISKATVKIPAQIYTGKAIEPNDTIEVKMNGKPLSKENYEIESYSNNINKGTATATIRGKNDCGGTKTVKFTIKGKGFLWWWKN